MKCSFLNAKHALNNNIPAVQKIYDQDWTASDIFRESFDRRKS